MVPQKSLVLSSFPDFRYFFLLLPPDVNLGISGRAKAKSITLTQLERRDEEEIFSSKCVVETLKIDQPRLQADGGAATGGSNI